MFEFQLMTPIVWLTRLLVGAYPHWEGTGPSQRQRIYFANHTSHLDTIVIWTSLPAVLRRITRPVAAKDYWSHGFFRKRIAQKELNVVLIDRRGGDHADPLAPLKDALRAGDSLIIFPEGTRRAQALPSEFKSGLWRLMREFPEVELIPVYIENLHRAMPKGVVIPVPTICSVRFGAPLEHSPTDSKEDFLRRARQAVIDLAHLGDVPLKTEESTTTRTTPLLQASTIDMRAQAAKEFATTKKEENDEVTSTTSPVNDVVVDSSTQPKNTQSSTTGGSL